MKRVRKLAWLLIAVCIMVSVMPAAQGASNKNTVVRVGFPIQHGISYLDENGEYAGYMVDYLEYLSLYTNWDYEFVTAEGDTNTQISTLMQMLMDGEIDMMGTMNYLPSLEEYFLYPSYSYGTTYTSLSVLEDSTRWAEEDFASWNGIKVASAPKLSQRMEELSQYAQLNHFTYEVIEYPTIADALEAVRTGEADAILQVDMAIKDNFRTIARFAPTPYYFALYKGNQSLLQPLNNAMYQMSRAYPYLQTELYDEYFYSNGRFVMSEQDREYIQDLGTLKVAFCDGNAPLQYARDGQAQGMAASYFEALAEATGLQYEPVIVQSCEDGIQRIQQGQVDLIACAASTSSYITVDGIQFTLPYYSGSSLLVWGPSGDTPSDDEDIQRFYTNTQSMLNNLRSGKIGCGRMDMYSINYYLQKQGLYDNLSVDWSSDKNVSYCIGVTSHVSGNLLSILNRYIRSISDAQSQNMFYQAMSVKVTYTPAEWLYVHRFHLLVTLIVLVLSLCLHSLYHNIRKARQEATRTQQQLEQLSRYDNLTGAYNDDEFRLLLSQACDQKIPLMLVALNLRNFKHINETYGLSIANQFLCRIKYCLDKICRPEEFFCRQSADVFYLALRENQADPAVDRIQALLDMIQKEAFELLGDYSVSVYCGCVLTAAAPEPFSAAAKHTYMMAALAQGKKNKKQSICIYDEALHDAEQMRLYVESHMQHALEQEEFRMYLQPKMDLNTGLLTGAEALVRWQTQDRGLIFPDQFIPLFEENGFCVQLDLYMVEQVCKQLRQWMDEGTTPINISVNQTRLLFVSEGYVEKLLAITEKYDISPRYITLEILESLALEHMDQVNACIDQLRAAGFRISMDDFGSGYSSLNTLGRLKIDELKLDRLFLMGVAKDTEGTQRKIMGCILDLAKQLNISTVAEGVETRENEQMMAQLSCNYGQGYYYSRPLAVVDFERDFLKPYSKHIACESSP